MAQKLTVIGVGRLGLCAALIFESKGYDVLGVDIFPAYVEALNNKSYLSYEPRVSHMLKESKNFRVTGSLEEALAFSNIIFIFVDTPTGVGEKSYDHSKLTRVLQDINKHKIQDKHVSIGCTVLPGFISQIGRYLLRDCVNTTLNYNPEFIAQGNIIHGFLNPDMVLIGEETKEAGDALVGIYKKVVDNQPHFCRMSAESAEICKLSVNCFITMKISYSNMIGDICDQQPGANKYDVLKAVGLDGRIGGKCLIPGWGFGGPCFPRDNRALGNFARSKGVEPILSNATDDYNRLHAKIMFENMLKEDRDQYVFEKVTYKDDCAVPIIEESQKLEVAKLLAKAGRKVVIQDRAVVIAEVEKEFGSLFQYKIV